MVELVDQYKDNALEHLEKPELFHVIQKLANYKSDYFLKKKFIPTFLSFFDLEAPTTKFLSDKMQVDDAIDFAAWMNPINQVGKFKEQVQGLETLCEEISEISNQSERFKKYLGSMFMENNDLDSIKILRRNSSVKEKEKKEEEPSVYLNKIGSLEMTQILVELLDRFIYYQKVALVISLALPILRYILHISIASSNNINH